MKSIEEIEENYQKMYVGELIELTKNPKYLRLDAIPVLQKELIKRGQHEEALHLTDFLIGSDSKARYRKMSDEELTQMIKDRIESGDSLEKIKLDLKEVGINMFDIMNKDHDLNEQRLDYITYLKQEGLSENQIDEKLKDTLLMDTKDSEMLKVELKKKGKQNIIMGYTFTIVAAFLILVSFSLGGRVTIGGIGVLSVGVWMISKGYDQRK